MRLSLRRYAGTANGDAATLDGLDSTDFVKADGTVTGASSQIQEFTNGVRASTVDTSSGDLNLDPASGIVAIDGSDLNLLNSGNAKFSIYAASDAGFAQYQLYRGKGSIASPTAVSSGISLGGISFRGYHSGSAYHNTGSVDIRGVSTEAFTASARGGELRIYTTATGTTSLSQSAVFSNDGRFGVGQTSPSAVIDIAASTTARSSLRIRSGTAPTTPNSGDLWFDGTNLKFYDGTTTRTLSWT